MAPFLAIHRLGIAGIRCHRRLALRAFSQRTLVLMSSQKKQ
jgi:hypothetical protein